MPGWNKQLQELQRQGLRRHLLTVDGRRNGLVQIAGRWLVDFSNNDYLGLSDHERCLEAACQHTREYGCGATASRVVSGGSSPHRRLESFLEALYEKSALIFPSGYQANLGSLAALVGPGDTIYSDAANHASIVDGCRLSRAAVEVYPHLDSAALEKRLSKPANGRRVIVSDSLFSMDGSQAPLADLRSLADQHGALLMVDEAHAIGVLGPGGRGLCAAHGLQPDLLIGTFSKALGGHGAFAIAEDSLIQWLVNRARSFMYTTALPPGVIGAAQTALELCQGSEGARLRQRSLTLAERLRAGLSKAGQLPSGQGSPIVSLGFPGVGTASSLSERLGDEQLVWAFRPPTVAPGSSHLRVTITAKHQERQVDRLLERLLPLLENEDRHA